MKKLLAVLLLLALLTGCTTNTPAPETAPAPTAPTTSTSPSSAPITQHTQSGTIPDATVATLPEEEGLTVHFIDVGQADCALIECDGEYMLIDAGYYENGIDVVEYLFDLGVEELDLMVGTHPHGDHIGGLPVVLDYFDTERIWFSAMPYTNGTVSTFLSAARRHDVEVEQPQVGDTYQLGSALVTMLGPVKTDYEDVNDISLVLRVDYGDTRFLFTGDMEAIAETDLLDSGADVKADVLKVGHHGSYSSTSYRFLREVAPTYAVISCGAGNEYGHPHDEPMSRLRDAEVIIYRTDRMYDIVAFSDGEEITFTWGNAYAKPWTPNAA